MYAIKKKKNRKFGYIVFFLKTAEVLGRFYITYFGDKQEPEQASKCPGVGEYHKNRNNVYSNEATIVTSRRKNIEVLVYSTDF